MRVKPVLTQSTERITKNGKSGSTPGIELEQHGSQIDFSAGVLSHLMNLIASFLAANLKRRFDHVLDDPEAYDAKVSAERKAYPFPEADLIPFVFPILAYAALTLRQGKLVPGDLRRMLVMVHAAIRVAARVVGAPGDDLEQLPNYQRQAVYLGLLNFALGAFRLATGDRRFEGIHRHLSRLLHEGLTATKGRPLWSFPSVSWPFDTIAPVLSLRLRELAEGNCEYTKTIRAHLNWIAGEGSDHSLELPWSMVPMQQANFSHIAPRGCALAGSISWLWALDQSQGIQWYRQFVEHFWRRRWLFWGFREWEEGRDDGEDLDSGPVIGGLGTAATGFGWMAAQVAGDRKRSAILGAEILAVITAVHVATRLRRERCLAVGPIRLTPGYLTGFLFGDACLFMAATFPSLCKDSVWSCDNLRVNDEPITGAI